jgi:Family of unknown function (DUF5677)
MMFSDLLPSDEEREWLAQTCAKFANFIQDCIGCLKLAYDLVGEASAKGTSYHHATVYLLTRHAIESLDGVSVLVSKSCSQPCQPLLRSALEAMLGIFYILEADSERRGLAYQLVHAHKKIKVYQRLDPTTDAGKQLRRDIAADPCADILNGLPGFDYPKMIAGLKAMFRQPMFQPLEAEWQRLKAARNNKDPEWYALFGGPTSVRDLAIRVGAPALYEFLYRAWSNEVHAGSAMEAIGLKDGETVIRPIRHPEELQPSVNFARHFSIALAKKIVEAYEPAKMADLRTLYIDSIRQQSLELASNNVVSAPWKDSAI